MLYYKNYILNNYRMVSIPTLLKRLEIAGLRELASCYQIRGTWYNEKTLTRLYSVSTDINDYCFTIKYKSYSEVDYIENALEVTSLI